MKIRLLLYTIHKEIPDKNVKNETLKHTRKKKNHKNIEQKNVNLEQKRNS